MRQFTRYVNGVVSENWQVLGNDAMATPDGWTDTTGQTIVAPPPVPQSVPLWQAQAVMASMPSVKTPPNANLLVDADNLAAATGGAVAIFWTRSQSIDRNDALLASLAASLGLSAANLDSLFIAAANVTL